MTDINTELTNQILLWIKDVVNQNFSEPEDIYDIFKEHKSELSRIISDSFPKETILNTNEPKNIEYPEELFEELRKIRFKYSEIKNVKPYFIYNNETLKILSTYRPVSLASALEIPGIGEVRIKEDYTKEMIQKISEYCETNNIPGNITYVKKSKNKVQNSVQNNSQNDHTFRIEVSDKLNQILKNVVNISNSLHIKNTF